MCMAICLSDDVGTRGESTRKDAGAIQCSMLGLEEERILPDYRIGYAVAQGHELELAKDELELEPRPGS